MVRILNEVLLYIIKNSLLTKEIPINIHKFIFYNLIQKTDYIKTFMLCKILHSYLCIINENQKLDVLNQLFEQCKVNSNLDLLCTVCNDPDIQSILIKDRRSFLYKDFWSYLANSISNLDNNNMQKQGTFLLAKWVDIYFENNLIAKMPSLMINDASNKEPRKIWENFFVLLSISKEKQVHLIKPALRFLKSIKYLDCMWQQCIYKILLNHMQKSVVKFVIFSILEENIVFPNLFRHLLHAISKYDFFHYSNMLLQKLPTYCCNMVDNIFFGFLDNVIQTPWTPFAMWYFFKELFSFKLKKIIPLFLFEPIYKMIFRIPHTYIRNSCAKIFTTYFISNYKWNDSIDSLCKMLLILKEHTEDIFVNVVNNLDPHIIDNFCKHLGANIGTMQFKIFLETIQILNHQSALQLMLENVNQLDTDLQIIMYSYCYNSTQIAVLERIVEQQLYTDLSHDSIDAVLKIIDSLMKHDSFNKEMYKRTVHILSEPNKYSQTAIYISLYSARNYFLSSETIAKIICNWKNPENLECRQTNEKILVLFIELYLLTTDKCDVLFLEDIFKDQSDLVVSRIFEFFCKTMFKESINRFEFLTIGLTVLTNLTKSKYFTTTVSNYINCVFLINWSNFVKHVNLLKIIINTLLTMCKVYPIIGYYLSKNMKTFIDNFECGSTYNIIIPVIIELSLEGIIIIKEDRVEYNVCQDILRKLENPEDNPNIRSTNTRLYSLDSLLSVTSRNEEAADIVASCLIEKYKIHFKKRYFPDSQIHLIKLRIIQLLLTIHPFIKTTQQTLIDLIMESFCVEIHQPCIRQLMQWLLFLLIKHEPDALSLIAIKIKNSSKTQPSSIAAFTMVLLFLTMSQPESFWMSTVELLLPWCMGPHFKLRVYAQMAIKSLYEEAMQRSYKEFLFKYSFLEKSIHFIIGASGQSFHDTLKSDELFFNKFNPERDYSLQTIFVDIPKLNNVTETEWENMVSNKFTSFEHIPILSENKIFAVSVTKTRSCEKNDEDVLYDFSCESDNIQRKITPWKVILEEEQDNQWLDFILIASLIDKPTNLGGLARTCEVFGIKQLVLNNEKVVNDKVFKGLSMSSENWIEIIEVKVDDLKKYIIGIREKGYCVLGAEQTSESISLNSYRFKKRTALLLGNEKEGIPPDIIPMLDACVEIPQFGVVRSLNVHVAGATFIWEYAKQHLI